MSELNQTNVNPQVASKHGVSQGQSTQPGRIDQSQSKSNPKGHTTAQPVSQVPGRVETQQQNDSEVPLHLILSGRTGAVNSNAPSSVQAAAVAVPANGATSQGRLMSEQEYLNSLHKENVAAPLMVAGIACVAAIFVHFVVGSINAGVVGGFIFSFLAVITLAFSIGVCFFVAKTAAAIFGEDYGNTIELLGKVAAVCGGYEIVFGGLTLFMNPLFAVIVGFPAIVLLAFFLIGMDAFQAFVFALASTALKFLISLLIIGTIFNAAMSAVGV